MEPADTVRIGLVGCGNISRAYLRNLTGRFRGAEVVACADLDPARAEALAAAAGDDGLPLWPGVKPEALDALYQRRDIDIILNLTIPKAHHSVAMKALEHGKHVYGEKPFAVSREEGAEMLRLAKEKNLRIGCAADTFLGAAAQTCRKLIDDGWIGEVVGATAFMCCHGHESWHPDPEFYYDIGGGPLLDMGPYYLAGLVNLAGPVKRVSALSRRTFSERLIASGGKKGGRIPVRVDTHISGSLEFESGAVGTLLMSFDVWKHSLPPIEIHGTEGSLSVPDPNTFGGEVRVCRGKGNWETVPLLFPHADNARGLGLLDMARAAVGGRPHRASGDLGFHVLDVMLSLHESGSKGGALDIGSTCKQPAAFPLNLQPYSVGD